MTWLQRYRIRHYMQNAIWIWPVLSMFAAMIAVRLLYGLDHMLGWESRMHPETARSVLGTMAGAMLTFIIFVCSSLLLVVQLASAQLTPRVIGTMFRDPVTKATLAVFVFAFTFVLAGMIRIGDAVPVLLSVVGGYSCAVSIGAFLYLIDHVGKMLRPSGALHSVATEAHRVIDIVYPTPLRDDATVASGPTSFNGSAPSRIIPCPKDGVVLAFDVPGIVALAERHDAIVELVPQVGNFVATAYPVFRVYGGGTLPDESLRQSIALGVERTMEQDPALAFRLIVDIASKALSPAINDPTTAVLAIDRIQHLLLHVGSRQLNDEKVRDSNGRYRLIYRTPNWEDFVQLAVTEIRQFGGTSIQVVRRLRAMLEYLLQNLPETRATPLRQELALLKRTAERLFPEPEDRALAEGSDAQGVGGTEEPGQPPC